MGQGIGVAQGFAIAGRCEPRFDSYCMVGDGELQEGTVWEAAMYAGQHHLDNLCVLVDRNHGQLDIHTKNVYPMPDFAQVFRAYGWEAVDVDSTQYDGIFAALEQFRLGPRNGKPLAIVCKSTKGYGACSDFLNRHKVTTPLPLIEQELEMQQWRRRMRVAEAIDFLDRLETHPGQAETKELLLKAAAAMHLELKSTADGLTILSAPGPVLTRRVPRRDKRIRYDGGDLPRIDRSKSYSAASIVTAAMKVFARDSRVFSIDSDLASTSGLESGVAAVDQSRALNAGVAEANMMLIGEAFAALGGNVWVSTFCPFFNWQVLRRIAVGQQERLEAIAAPNGWLSEGHGLDLTFLATAANFETRTNGATHMGNDDITTLDGVAHLKIIDVSCPRQLLAIMQWIMEGNRGLVYLRVMRAESGVLYGSDFQFEFGKGYKLREDRQAQAIRRPVEIIGTDAAVEDLGLAIDVEDLGFVEPLEDVAHAQHDHLVADDQHAAVAILQVDGVEHRPQPKDHVRPALAARRAVVEFAEPLSVRGFLGEAGPDSGGGEAIEDAELPFAQALVDDGLRGAAGKRSRLADELGGLAGTEVG